jgi:hypothetical protein
MNCDAGLKLERRLMKQPDGGASMDARDATANNADLWAHYLREQWRQFLDPFGLADAAAADATGRVLADVAAANVSSVLTTLMGPGVGRMFQSNVAEVSRTLAAAAAPDDIEIPEAYAARKPADLTQREEWVVSSARETVAAY